MLVAAADENWNPRTLDERFEMFDGRPVPLTGTLGDWCVLARVWPSAGLKRKDVYLRGRTHDMLGDLDASRNLLLICSKEGDVDSEEEVKNGGYASEVEVKILMLKPFEKDEERMETTTRTPNKTPPAQTTPKGGKFVAMSPNMRDSVGETPSPLYLNSVSSSNSVGRGREGGRSSEKKKKGKKGVEQGRTSGAEPSGTLELPSTPSLLSFRPGTAPSSIVANALKNNGTRVNAVLQSLVRGILRDTWLLPGAMYPIPFLDARLGAVVSLRHEEVHETKTTRKNGPFRIGPITRIIVRTGDVSNETDAGTGGSDTSTKRGMDANYAPAAVASLQGYTTDDTRTNRGKIDATIESSVHKAATAGYLSLCSLRLAPTNRSASLLKTWITYPLRNYEIFRSQGVLPPTGVLLHGPPGTGKTLLARWVARDAGAKLFIINGSEMMSEFLGDSERCLSAVFTAAKALSPAIVFIDEIDVLGPSRNDGKLSKTASRLVATLAGELDEIQGYPVMVVGATNRKEALDESLRRPRRLEKELEIGVPDPEERMQILEGLLSQVAMDEDITTEALRELAMRAHGYVGADLLAVVSEASMIALRRCVNGRKGNIDGLQKIVMRMHDLQTAVHHTKPSALREFSSDIPDVSLNDVGGNHELKQRLIEAVEWPIKFKDRLDEMGAVPPKGILLCGPPGCSKTLLVKAIAGECRLNFFSVKGPELMSKYVGESEKALAHVFDKARKASPSILFFDEIDGLVGARSTSGGGGVDVGERVLSQMLQEMDGIKGKEDQVIIIGATNRMDKLDKALLRPGRFDRVLQVALPSPADRREILCIHMRRVPSDTSVVLEDIVARTDGFSGAELAGLVQRAAMHALCEDANVVRGIDFLSVLSV